MLKCYKIKWNITAHIYIINVWPTCNCDKKQAANIMVHVHRHVAGQWKHNCVSQINTKYRNMENFKFGAPAFVEHGAVSLNNPCPTFRYNLVVLTFKNLTGSKTIFLGKFPVEASTNLPPTQHHVPVNKKSPEDEWQSYLSTTWLTTNNAKCPTQRLPFMLRSC
jgi:hypothetical protein